MLDTDGALKTTERSSFTVVDIMPDKMTFPTFAWRPPQPVENIDTMAPTPVHDVKRRV